MGLEFCTNPGSFCCSDLGTISGEFYLRIGDAFFPEERWSDLVVPVANAWLHAIQDLVHGASWQERASFMDGPFRADLTMTREGVVIVNLVEGRLRGDLIHHSVEVDPLLLFRDAIATATQILEECRLRGWSNSNTEEMARCLKDARKRSVESIQ